MMYVLYKYQIFCLWRVEGSDPCTCADPSFWAFRDEVGPLARLGRTDTGCLWLIPGTFDIN